MTYTGKQRDNHSTFDYYYFGARYYDYRIGQFTSIDKAAQTPGGFLYAGNNPIIIIDPDGNLFGIDDLIAGAIGGVVNLTTNLIQGNVSSLWQGLGYFGAGFAGGVLSVHPEIGGPILAGVLLGGANTALAGGDFGDVVKNAAIGGVAGAVGWGAAKGVVPTGQISGIPIIDGAIKGAIGGAAAGFGAGTTAGLLSGQSMGNALRTGLSGMYTGAYVGAFAGAGAASAQSLRKGINPFTGKPMFNPPKPSDLKGGAWPVNKGKAGVEKAKIDLPKHGIKISGTKVHVKIGNRTRVYDLAGIEDGKLVLIEVKNGPTAGYDFNQRACNSMLIEGVKPVPFGPRAADAYFQVGVPTNVKIITIWYNGNNNINIQILERQY